MTDQSNVLLIISDQQRADCCGFENPKIKHPTSSLTRTGSTQGGSPNLRAALLTKRRLAVISKGATVLSLMKRHCLQRTRAARVRG